MKLKLILRKNRLGIDIEINIEAEMYALSKQFIALPPFKQQATMSRELKENAYKKSYQ